MPRGFTQQPRGVFLFYQEADFVRLTFHKKENTGVVLIKPQRRKCTAGAVMRYRLRLG